MQSSVTPQSIVRYTKKSSLLISCLFAVFSLFAFYVAPTQSFADISGTVFLPEAAPTGGLSVQIYASNQNGSKNGYSNVTINAGETSVPYTLTVSSDPAADQWTVSYYYTSGSEPYLIQGYYSTSGTTRIYDLRTLLTGASDYTGIDLTLIAGKTISGTVTAPANAPTGGLNVSIRAYNQNSSGNGYDNITIAQGATSAAYSMVVPNDSGLEWYVFYEYYGSAPYLSRGYYSTSGTTRDSAQKTLLTGDSDYPGIDLTLLTGKTIGGTVVAPAAAPAGGLNISIYAYNQNGSGSGFASIAIAQGATSAAYSMIVPDDSEAQWYIDYSYSGSAPYLTQGYYSANGTTWDSSQKTLLPGGSNHAGINLTLLTGNTISGTVTLPNPAPVGGFSVQMYAEDQNGSGSGSAGITIAQGETSASYNLLVPIVADAQWQVEYSCWGNDSYFRSGYYNATTTTWNEDNATLLTGGVNHSGINLTLITAKTISGSVTLPAAATQDIDVEVYGFYRQAGNGCSPYSYPTFDSTYITIAPGSTSATYTVAVPNDATTQWSVLYSIDSEAPYVSNGYYNATATTWDQDQATFLAGGVNHTGKNLTLLTGNTIRGAITLPAPATEVTFFEVYTGNENYGPGAAWTYVVFLAGEQTGEYTFHVAPDPSAQWRVEYWCDGDGAYITHGYYNATETTWNKDQATLLTGGANYTGINMTMMSGKIISGTISLPSASEGEYVVIDATDRNGGGNDTEYSSWVYINPGATSAAYKIAVPALSTAQWQISASLAWRGSGVNYYYRSPATTWDSALATLLPGATGHTGINMLIPTTWHTITGKVLLPAGKTAPINNMTATVFAVTASGSIVDESAVNFQNGRSYGTYEMAVPDVDGAQWLVKYENYQESCSSDEQKKISEGYYSTTATVGKSQATPLSGEASHANINLSILKIDPFSWNPFLPAIIRHN